VPLGDVTPAAGAFVLWVESNVSEGQVGEEVRREHKAVCDALRDVIGNPFRSQQPILPAVLAWNDSCVLRIAQGIYDDRDFDRLPILHDALLDAGCDNDDILAHCRGAGPHVRGCWVIDLLLGKA
jgi:hypothetical protein